jgi:shikimate kinase
MHQKLKGSPGIYVVGFMGSGKTTIGNALAARLGWEFVDLDDEIVERAGKSIPEVFENDGEPAFRRLESDCLKQQTRLVCTGRARVVGLGGGTFVDDQNREMVEEAGVSIWLDAPATALWERVKAETHRPLAQDEAAFRERHDSRKAAYARADFHVDATQETTAIVAAIMDFHLI